MKLAYYLAFTGLSLSFSVWGFDPLPQIAPAPANNPTTPAKIALGQELYFDARLSKTGSVSCNTCHNVTSSGDDGRSVSMGVYGLTGTRSAPTVWNSGLLSVQFWDGRAPTLEEQAKGPLVNAVEMGMKNLDAVVALVNSIPGYVTQFQQIFPGKNPVTIDHIVQTIAAYERTLLTPQSPLDRFLAGDKQALSSDAQKGMALFQSVGCIACHSGANFAGPTLPLGTGFFQKFPINSSSYDTQYHLTQDLGRYTTTHQSADKNMWRVPSLRLAALTAPYFHNGQVPTLDIAVRVMAKSQLNKTLTDQEVLQIVAFLNALPGKFPVQNLPLLPNTSNHSVVIDEGPKHH